MEPPSQRGQETVAKRHGRPRSRRALGTILLVEDDAGVSGATALFLENAGYRVLTAATDEQALWLWKRHGPEVDLVVTDLMIPTQHTGVELARHFRAERPTLPVILTSGFGRDIGDDDPSFPSQMPFMQKPFDPGELLTLIEALLAC